jgi:hypothetical protein
MNFCADDAAPQIRQVVREPLIQVPELVCDLALKGLYSLSDLSNPVDEPIFHIEQKAPLLDQVFQAGAQHPLLRRETLLGQIAHLRQLVTPRLVRKRVARRGRIQLFNQAAP